MFDYYAHKMNMEELAKRNEETRAKLQAQQEREERKRLIQEEKQHEVRKLPSGELTTYIYLYDNVSIMKG